MLFKQKPNASGLEMIVCVYTKSTERFKYHFYAIEVKLSLNFKFIGPLHTKRMDFSSVYIKNKRRVDWWWWGGGGGGGGGGGIGGIDIRLIILGCQQNHFAFFR